MVNIDEILQMKYPSQLFTGDKDIAKKEHIDLLKLFHPDLHKNSEKYKEVTKPIRNYKVKRAFRKAQKISEQNGYDERIKALQFDEVLRLQKEQVNKKRQEIMELRS